MLEKQNKELSDTISELQTSIFDTEGLYKSSKEYVARCQKELAEFKELILEKLICFKYVAFTIFICSLASLIKFLISYFIRNKVAIIAPPEFPNNFILSRL